VPDHCIVPAPYQAINNRRLFLNHVISTPYYRDRGQQCIDAVPEDGQRRLFKGQRIPYLRHHHELELELENEILRR
jgi:hypothetical protein